METAYVAQAEALISSLADLAPLDRHAAFQAESDRIAGQGTEHYMAGESEAHRDAQKAAALLWRARDAAWRDYREARAMGNGSKSPE